MSNSEDNKQKKTDIANSDESVEKGKKAIEANRKFNNPDAPKEEKDKAEEKDAEKWRSEG